MSGRDTSEFDRGMNEILLELRELAIRGGKLLEDDEGRDSVYYAWHFLTIYFHMNTHLLQLPARVARHCLRQSSCHCRFQNCSEDKESHIETSQSSWACVRLWWNMSLFWVDTVAWLGKECGGLEKSVHGLVLMNSPVQLILVSHRYLRRSQRLSACHLVDASNKSFGRL